MKQFSELLGNQNILPIIQADTEEQGVRIAKCMSDAGIHLVEVVLRTEASLKALSAIKFALPELIVGAGTVTNKHKLNQAIAAGADFIVTPAVSDELLNDLNASGLVCLPGVSNTADILKAQEHGFTEMKLFPASLSGGAPFLKAVSSVFQEVSFCPTGGVSSSNKNDFIMLDNVFAVGGTWMVSKEAVQAENWRAIVDACQEARK